TKNAFDADSLVEKIGAGLAFEAHEAVEIEDVRGAAIVREIGELQRRDGDLVGDVLELGAGEISADVVFLQALARLLFGLADEVLQLEHAASAGLERLAVRAVHGAEADVLELFARDVTGLGGGAVDLLEVISLALIDRVEDHVRVLIADPLKDRGEVG